MKETLALILTLVLLPVFFLGFGYQKTGNTGQAVLVEDSKLTCGENKYCGEKIEITCAGCTEEHAALLKTMGEYQESVTECLSDYFVFEPEKTRYFASNPQNFVCNHGSCFVGGISFNGFVKFSGFPTALKKGEKINLQNIAADVHETTHAFAFQALGPVVPKWFDEGLAIQTDARLKCHPKQVTENRMNEELLQPVLLELKNGEKISEVIEEPTEHDRGALFFYALEKEFGCGKECVARLFKNLYALRLEKIVQGKGFSTASPFLTNEIIKEETEKIVGKEVSWVFEALEIRA